jgi:hypothetical protein
MTLRPAMSLALRDFYENSWRLVVVNAALGVVLVVAVLATLAEPVALVLVVATGPVVAALVHCAVTLVRTGDLTFADAFHGLRLHWRRGLALAGAGAAVLGLGILALRFYSTAALWPLAFLTLYLLVLLGTYMLVLWTVAIAAPERSLAGVARESVALAMARPGQTLGLGFALVLVNLAGIAAAVMPFLTLTVAYTFLVTARFFVPPEEEEAV